MDLKEAQKKSGMLNEKFKEKRKTEWRPEVMFTDLVEEVGELANAILTKQGFKSEKRKKSDLADSLCDIMFDVFMIAEYYGIDIDKEFTKVLKGLEKRLDKGDFD